MNAAASETSRTSKVCMGSSSSKARVCALGLTIVIVCAWVCLSVSVCPRLYVCGAVCKSLSGIVTLSVCVFLCVYIGLSTVGVTFSVFVCVSKCEFPSLWLSKCESVSVWVRTVIALGEDKVSFCLNNIICVNTTLFLFPSRGPESPGYAVSTTGCAQVFCDRRFVGAWRVLSSRARWCDHMLVLSHKGRKFWCSSIF